MSIGEPFLLRPLAGDEFFSEWSDHGTGGDDWAIMSIKNSPSGYAPLGDYLYAGHLSSTKTTVTINPTKAFSIQSLFVRTNRRDIARPCTDYVKVRSMPGDFTANIWRPVYVDPANPTSPVQFVGAGDVCLRGENKPRIGKYYCLNTRYFFPTTRTAERPKNSDGIPCFRTLAGTNIFRAGVANNQQFALLDDNTIIDCCTKTTDRPANCGSLSGGSIACQNAMLDSCSAADIKPGGKCEDWCTRDPINCDKIKNQFCVANPNDPFCDCINAFSRADHNAFVKDKEAIYSMSVPACYYSKCKLGPSYVFTTTTMPGPNSERCVQDLKLIDQRINVSGTGNVVDADQTVNEGDKAVDANAPGEDEKKSNTYLYLLGLLFVVLVAMYMAFGRSDETQTDEYGQMYGQPQMPISYGQSMYSQPQMPISYGQQPMQQYGQSPYGQQPM